MKASDFFALPASLAPFAEHFPTDVPAWEWVARLAGAFAKLPPPPAIAVPAGVRIEGPVWLDPTVKLGNHATLIGPAWIGANTDVRPGAYVRGNVIVGERCVLGNSCEFKNCLLMDDVQVPHFSYVGDSILGNRSHLGAGAICSNLRLDRRPVTVRAEAATLETGLRKFGAVLGDEAEVGCNAVLQPGTLLGKRALVHPLTAFGGYLAPAMIVGGRHSPRTVPRRD
ncbi:MAG TPA: UDP-N-acetylglucosamine diphosphorylase [Opitutus sp.]|nr:UDP-N-acetylglucosamine diphosphorylase [Opitutus sp.]